MKPKYKYLFLLFIAVPDSLWTQEDGRIGYEDMTPAARKSVDEFIKDYAEAVYERLSPLGEEAARTVSARLRQTIRKEYMLEFAEANETEIEIFNEYPDSTLLLSRMAAMSYYRGVYADNDRQDFFKKTIEYSERCLDIEPENGECWFFYGAGLGEYITTVGIFKTISHIREVHDAFEKAVKFTSEDPFPFGPMGMTSRSAAYMGITQFYRICPDWWVMKLIAGIRGDRKKAYEYSREIDPADFDRASIRAKAAICYGAAKNNREAIVEGKEIVRKAAGFDMVNPRHFYVRKRILRLNEIFTNNDDLDLKDYYKIGCRDFDRPAEL